MNEVVFLPGFQGIVEFLPPLSPLVKLCQVKFPFTLFPWDGIKNLHCSQNSLWSSKRARTRATKKNVIILPKYQHNILEHDWQKCQQNLKSIDFTKHFYTAYPSMIYQCMHYVCIMYVFMLIWMSRGSYMYILATLPLASSGFAAIGCFRASPYDGMYDYEELFKIDCIKIREIDCKKVREIRV